MLLTGVFFSGIDGAGGDPVRKCYQTSFQNFTFLRFIIINAESVRFLYFDLLIHHDLLCSKLCQRLKLV